ncbi:alpha/beta hydrolase [Nocardioides mangrovicus]|uniref:Alpha/beta hydrolase n=1 Tax=Nocardioides mangrovicus TaxID=2478913 RepID=A0A3L8P014_9ACTN|nr:alpha/beta hydrolase [Nocardioides mangrovicus]RLV48252.1 alpha/beta hydrolase [Nocardioides mangrovicus]
MTPLRYADHTDGVADLYLPEREPTHLVVHLHGGFWRQAYDRDHARPVARALAEAGAAVVLPEYRRVGAGGGWPTTCEDVRTALERLPSLLPFVPRTVTLSGHSAGGHLALWLACSGARVDRVVPIAPVGDLRHAAATGMGDGAVRDFLGVDHHVDDADPAALLARHRPAYPIEILHGTDDDVVSIENSRGLVAAHPWVGLVELGGAGHFDVVDPQSAVWPRVQQALLDPPTD